MDVFYTYIYGTAGWLTLQALPQLVAPKVIVTLLSPDVRKPTDLEIYYARSNAIALLTLAVTVLFFTGTIPLSSSVLDPVTTDENDPKAPYAVPIIRVTTGFHCAYTIYDYVRYTKEGQIGFCLGMIGSGIMASIGLWCILFATDKGHISRRTGADKRTSGFPFGNSEAAKKKAGKRF